MHIFAKIAKFCKKKIKIIDIPVERPREDDSNDVNITLQMLYPDGKNNC